MEITNDDSKVPPLFLLDSSVMQDFLEGEKESAVETINKILEIKSKGGKIKAVTNISSLQRAIFQTKKLERQDLLRLLDALTVMPNVSQIHGVIDYKDEKAVQTELILLANFMSGKISPDDIKGMNNGNN